MSAEPICAMVRPPYGVAVIHIAKGALNVWIRTRPRPRLGEERPMPGAERDPNHEYMKLEAWRSFDAFDDTGSGVWGSRVEGDRNE